METDLHKLRLRLATIEHQQDALNFEITRLQKELDALERALPGVEVGTATFEAQAPAQTAVSEAVQTLSTPTRTAPPSAPPQMAPLPPPSFSTPLEKRIGENFSSIIGTIILVLGVSIGIKYAIDHDLISPTTRIVLAYLTGSVLFGVAQRLRPKYPELSAVILGGAMSIVYFSTYAAHQFYNLMGQTSAFALMVAITVLTVWQALAYQRQSIAIGGLVGAYGIPFLLSHGEDNPVFLFTYISIVNVGILYIAFWRNWRYLRPLAFAISWFLLLLWCLDKSADLPNLRIGLSFLSVFFFTFYGMWLMEQLRQTPEEASNRTAFGPGDAFYLFFNACLYFVLGYFRLDFEGYRSFQGLFALFNLGVHLGVSYWLFRRFAQAPPFAFLSRFAIALSLLFFAIQFDGLAVTLGWAATFAGIFWIGRRYRLPVYEIGTLLILPFLLLRLWINNESRYFNDYSFGVPAERFESLLNPIFFTNLAVIAAVLAVFFLHRRSTQQEDGEPTAIEKVLPFWAPALLVVATGLTYTVFFHEIHYYFNQQYADSLKIDPLGGNEDLHAFKIVWLIQYTMAFIAILNYGANKIQRQPWARNALGILSLGTVGVFLTLGLYVLGALKNRVLEPDSAFPAGSGHLYLRYVSMVLLAVLLWTTHRLQRPSFEKAPALKQVFELVLHGTILWVISSELVHWLELYGLHDRSYKMALSILFGAYALMMVFLGIQKNARHLRLAAIALFGVTLLKLLLYDLAHLSTIPKTIVLVSLGSLLLVVSYLYNRFADKIFEDEQ